MANINIVVNTKEAELSGYETSALLITGCRKQNENLLCTRDTYIWSSLIFDLVSVTKDLKEDKIDEALDNAFSVYHNGQNELLKSGLDFISYLNNRHVPLKDLVIEFVDYVFKHCKDDNIDHYLSYVQDIIRFIENSYLKSNDALDSLKLKGLIEESFVPANLIMFDLVPTSFFTITDKGKTVIDELTQQTESLPPTITKLMGFEPIIEKVYKNFFSSDNTKA